MINDEGGERIRTEVVAPPFGESVRVADGTEDCQVEDERDDLGSTVQSTSDDVVVCIP